MAAKFEIRSPKTGEFNWVLTSQGRTLATGESYTRKVSAEKAIASLRKAAGTATVADLTLRPAKAPVAKAAPAKRAAKPAAKTAPVKRAAKAAPAKRAAKAAPAKAAAAAKPAKRATRSSKKSAS